MKMTQAQIDAQLMALDLKHENTMTEFPPYIVYTAAYPDEVVIDGTISVDHLNDLVALINNARGLGG
jgi:precorrin-4 methylase